MYKVKELKLPSNRQISDIAYSLYHQVEEHALNEVEPEIDKDYYQMPTETERLILSCSGNKRNDGVVYLINLEFIKIDNEKETYHTEIEKLTWWQDYFYQDPTYIYNIGNQLNIYFHLDIGMTVNGNLILIGNWKELTNDKTN